MSSQLRVAVANWSSRRVGGIEEYIASLIPALHAAGAAVAFWYESHGPADRSRIELPRSVLDLCAREIGLDAATDALRAWHPDVIYTQGLTGESIERRLQQIAPSIFFLHTYTGTCISGGKAFTRPLPAPCSRKFGWPCVFHYFPNGC